MKFSIVIPLYNKQDKIEDCLRSVITQSFHDYEVIVVNDGSTDDSVSILKAIIKNNPEIDIKLLMQENCGVSAARNAGAGQAATDYICFLDADDEWKSYFLEKMLHLIEDFPEANLYCLGHEIYRPEVGIYKPKHGCDSDFRGYIHDFFEASTKGSVAKSSKICVRKHAFELTGGFPTGEKVGEDLHVWMMLALQGKVACEPIISATIYQMPDESRRERASAIPYPIEYFRKKENKKLLTRSAKAYLKKIILMHFLGSSLKRDYNTAFSIWRKSLKMFPFSVSLYFITALLPVNLLRVLRKKRAMSGISNKLVAGANTDKNT